MYVPNAPASGDDFAIVSKNGAWTVSGAPIVTKADVLGYQQKVTELDGRVGELEAAGGGASITVDSAFSETSENPVQNKVITAAMREAVSLLLPRVLPDVTAEDSGKLLQVVDGAWAAVAIAAAENESF